MPEIGTKRDVSPDELDKIIKDSLIAPIAILEKWFCGENEAPDFFNYLTHLNGRVSDWDKGRIFDDRAEIRWEREGNGFHLVWIKDAGNIPDRWDKESLSQVNVRQILLWGERIGGGREWYEKQVPRIFEYPAKGNGSKVYVVLNEYTFEDGSTVYRFKEVIAK
ncbi:MAG: hypothetical protein IBX72_13880 [Nitrospirae bacterium]|nr:hypothetical protein [Nitrospirota bacterium]